MNSRSFRGKHDGSRLLITAGVHGDEFAPMLAVCELVRQFETSVLPANSLHGSVTFVPVVNESAFERGNRCGEDDLDLARACPGETEGTITERTAAELSALIRDAGLLFIGPHMGDCRCSKTILV